MCYILLFQTSSKIVLTSNPVIAKTNFENSRLVYAQVIKQNFSYFYHSVIKEESAKIINDNFMSIKLD